jgi:hypothetical protein
MTRYNNIILDFDGLLTDIKKESEHVVEIFRANVAAHLGMHK